MKNIDLFALLNLLLFGLLCIFRYHARFLQYRGAEHIHEFFIYAVGIILLILALWLAFRRFRFDSRVLVLLEIGILMHFSGAFVQIDGHRLYDSRFFDIRYDKYVHFVNALVVSMLVGRLFVFQKIASHPINGLFILLIVLGLGSVVEIVEYGVCKTIPGNGVGDYDNNLQDLISNLAGGFTYLLLVAFRSLPARLNSPAPLKRLGLGASRSLPVREESGLRPPPEPAGQHPSA